MRLNLGLRRDFIWHFVIAAVGTPIIGSDFLAHYNIMPDCHNRRILDGSTQLMVALIRHLSQYYFR